MATINEQCYLIASNGDITPPAVNPSGGNANSTVFSVNYGFPRLMGTSLGAGGSPVPRDEMNGGLNYLATFLNQITGGLQVSWISTITYSKDCIVFDPTSKNYYRSLQDSNTNHALTDTTWWEVQQSPNPSVLNPDIYRYKVTTVFEADNSYVSGNILGTPYQPSWSILNTSGLNSYSCNYANKFSGGSVTNGTFIEIGAYSNGSSRFSLNNVQTTANSNTTLSIDGENAPSLTYGSALTINENTIATLPNIIVYNTTTPVNSNDPDVTAVLDIGMTIHATKMYRFDNGAQTYWVNMTCLAKFSNTVEKSIYSFSLDLSLLGIECVNTNLQVLPTFNYIPLIYKLTNAKNNILINDLTGAQISYNPSSPTPNFLTVIFEFAPPAFNTGFQAYINVQFPAYSVNFV